jgi:chemotaxis protein methyltransferase CheR
MPEAESRGSVPTVPLPLAYGDLSDSDAIELRRLKELIAARTGLHCDGYKESCLRRRIAVRMRACAAHTYGAYTALLQRDAAEEQRLLEAVTINVSKFCRNPDVWEAVRRIVVPALFALDAPRIRIWSAGCAGGEEPYSMAMAILEHAQAHGLDASRFTILGTDIDRKSLAAAATGVFGPFAFTELPDAQRERWFEGSGPWRMREEVRRLVRFGVLDLMKDTPPVRQHVVLCRNVVIYFERPMQEALFRRFRDSVRPGGFLVLGKAESLVGDAARAFRPVAARERVFRRE